MASRDAAEVPKGTDPEEFLRALLRVTPEDAAKVREAADTKANPKDD